MQPQLIVFDLGRVLIRLCDDWPHACRRLGIKPPVIPTDADSKSQFAKLASDYDTGRIDLHAFSHAVAEIGGFSADEVVRVQQNLLLEPYPGVETLLNDLLRANLRTACLSNTVDNHWTMVHDPAGPHALPMHLFTHKFASHLLGLDKPDPRIYAHVERETGVAPEQIVFFDDLKENIAAARARNWNGFVIDITEDPIAQIRSHLGKFGIAVA